MIQGGKSFTQLACHPLYIMTIITFHSNKVSLGPLKNVRAGVNYWYIWTEHLSFQMEMKIHGNYYHFWMVYLWKGINKTLFWKNECKISIFSFGHSDWVWVDAEKMIKKPLLHLHPLWVKSQICIGNVKIEKLKTWPHSKIILDQGHVLGNANFSPGRQICDFTLRQSFFLRLKMKVLFSKWIAKIPSK